MQLDDKLELSTLEYWARMPGWTIKEQAALLLELDPSDEIPTHKAKQFNRLKGILKRAQRMRLLRSPTPPIAFLKWVDNNPLMISVPSSLREEVKKQSSHRWRSLNSTERRELMNGNMRPKTNWTKNKSYKTVMSAILVIAIEKYRYRPDGGGPASRNIATAMERLLVDAPKQQTISNLLKRASKDVGGNLKSRLKSL